MAFSAKDVDRLGIIVGMLRMSPPGGELLKLVLERRIARGGHPVLRWMMDSIFIRADPAGNIKPDKEKTAEKIDGAGSSHPLRR